MTEKEINIRKRNEMIYDEWLAGASQRELSRKYDLALTGIATILKRVEYIRNHPNDAIAFLQGHYNDVSGNLVSGAIGPILRNYSRNHGGPWLGIQQVNTKEKLFEILENMTDKDILKLRCIGIRKLEFINRVKADHAAGII